jgi:hypothetical protein
VIVDEKDKTVDGQSYYAAHLTGSGTIQSDGTYGPPTPDPTVLRGGPAGERTSPGGVERPLPATLVAPAQKIGEVESGERKAVTSRKPSTPKQ